ncbi:isthmin-2-like [Cheilinus undulatus]|uniref:isthmin-2-like n=1 Tax=Cheilinus undulatus TaxID=241271 RepID=UPI001BD26BB2|nr:isthmin-2-like [Cheilinus undulatus]
MERRKAGPDRGLTGPVLLVVVFLTSVCGFPTNIDRNSTETDPKVSAEHSYGKDMWTLEEREQENLLQTPSSAPASSWSRLHWVHGVLPSLTPEEDSTIFILNLRNFPELANADMSSQNPNIQVTIEVVDDAQTEVEMDLAKDSQRSDWSGTSSMWASSHRKLFWPLFWDYPYQLENERAGQDKQPKDHISDHEESVLSGVGGDWRGHWDNGWDTKDDTYVFEDDWSTWAPCSATCGHGTQKRTRSCGYACTATESRSCDLLNCPESDPSVTESDLTVTESPHSQTTSGSNALTAGMDSCEQWLSCKNDFLLKYLQQVLTELPSCPCSYPSEVVYRAVNIADLHLGRTYRWRDASGTKERLDIYKPSARFCIRSMLSYHSTTLAAQHCCYDDQMRLITRGSGAGSPDLISTEFSAELHYQVDVLPWILCKGDWSRFHAIRPPNNGLDCTPNPPDHQFQTQLTEAREY